MKLEVFDRKLAKARELSTFNSDFAGATRLYEELATHRPTDPYIWMEYASAAGAACRSGQADKALKKALNIDPTNAKLLNQVGHQYDSLRLPLEARACFERALAADPADVDPRISLAAHLEKQHQAAEARVVVNECLSAAPDDEQARYVAALLDRREQKLAEAEDRLRDLINSEPRHEYVRYACRYELAQILDATGRFDEAMEQLLEAKNMVGALTDTNAVYKMWDRTYNPWKEHIKHVPKDVLHVWNKSFPEKKRSGIPRLAFLGGHPRSGTTLMEKILDAHPAIEAFDETGAFPRVMQAEIRKHPELKWQRLNVLRRVYLEALLDGQTIDTEGKLLLDKNPSPTSFLPDWLRVFPELRVVIALRDPRDVVISCYFQNLPLNNVNANFLSLERIAKQYTDIMDVWLAVREWPGFSWLETRYEDTVANLAEEGRRVTEFLGLDWHEEQERFYTLNDRRQVFSPTYREVTNPVYNRAVSRWRAYEKHLEPIMPVLEPYCRALGYS